MPPTLVYDGDCGFCRYWVAYWRELTDGAVRYVAYQQLPEQFPAPTQIDWRNAIQLITPDGHFIGGAGAAFEVLALAGRPALARLYHKISFFARLSETGYRFVATRRSPALQGSKFLWGDARHPATFNLATAWFLRLIAIIYIIAFSSFGTQVEGLIGEHGITPLHGYLPAVLEALGTSAYWQLPSIFWLSDADATLLATCAAGVLAGSAALLGLARGPALLLAYVLYLSLFYAGQSFMSFQWDLLLLEAGFLAVLATTRLRATPLLFRLLLFRFMFLSGCVKLLSGDPSWESLAALDFHYETQPLPTILAWYAHQAPMLFQHLCVALTLVIELALPFLIFAPRRPRMLAAMGFIALETLIMLTGNYNFFNLLTIGLTLFLFDDHQLRNWGLQTAHRSAAPATAKFAWCTQPALVVLAGWIFAVGIVECVRPFSGNTTREWLDSATEVTRPLRIINGYGLFAVMTTTRREIIIEGSADARRWLAYDFRYKPGELSRAPVWVTPHQPRLDWQMWFAALGSADSNPWFGNFLSRLLTNEPSVTSLLAKNPFRAAPPRFVRALLYEYHFSTPAERRHSGNWWTRKLVGIYYPATILQIDRP